MESQIAESHIVLLEESRIEAAGEMLSGAFFEDLLVQHVFPDPEARRRVLAWHYSALVRFGWLFGDVYVPKGTAEGTVDGVAVWLPDLDPEGTWERLEQSGLDQAPAVLGAEAFQRFAGVVGHLERLRQRDVPPLHWYLSVLGVSPSRQGQGLGGALLRPILADADADGYPCYLETFEAKNAPFYQRHGFEIVVDDVEPSSGLRFWTFRRDPRG